MRIVVLGGMMGNKSGILLFVFVWLAGCSGLQNPSSGSLGTALPLDPPPAAPSTNVLPSYDAAVARILIQAVQYPTSNESGYVVWSTRYYLESLLAAYNATGNSKYIQSFLDTGQEVLDLEQSISVADVVDPSFPFPPPGAPQITVTGWLTYEADFGVPLSIPTAEGGISFYAQQLYPALSISPLSLVVSQGASGGMVLTWMRLEKTIETDTVYTQADIDAIAARPLVYGNSVYRISSTEQGLPAPGTYVFAGIPLMTAWHGEQTGGILLPYVRFLLLVKQRPTLAPSSTVTAWTNQVLATAASYENQLVPDGKGGLLITNPIWMPNTDAGLTAPSDYINVEITLRMLLYELTGDQHELSLAQGLFAHELPNLPVGTQGWLLMKDWPDAVNWSTKSQAPVGNIFSSLSYSTTTAESSGEGKMFVDMLQTAMDYGLVTSMGIPNTIIPAQQLTFAQYIRVPSSGSRPLVRSGYPSLTSTSSDPVDPSSDPFVDAEFLQPIVSDPTYVCDNWNWMLANGQAAEPGDSVGYTLLGWARSEAAVLARGSASAGCPTR